MFQRSRTVAVHIACLVRPLSSHNAKVGASTRQWTSRGDIVSTEADETRLGLVAKGASSLRGKEDLFTKFIYAVNLGDAATVRTMSRTIRHKIREAVNAGSDDASLTTTVIEVVTDLWRKDSQENTHLVGEILRDISSQSGLTESIHGAVFNELLQFNAVARAHLWLLYRCRETGGPATLSQVDALLKRCAENHNISLAQSIIESLGQLGVPLTTVSVRKYIKALCRSGYELSAPQLRDFVTFVKARGVTWDSPTLSILRHWAESQQHNIPLLREVVDIYHSAFDNQNLDDLDERLAHTAQTKGKWAAISLLHQSQRLHGFVPSQETLKALVRKTPDVSMLKYWEKVLEIKAGSDVWAILIDNVFRQGNGASLTVLYREALSSGVAPTKSMLHLVLRSLCSSALTPPTAAAVEEAYTLYKEYVSYVDGARQEASMYEGSSMQLDAPIYNTLLRALCSSTDEKHLGTALELLEDMKARGITMDPMTLTSITVLFIRCSKGYYDAYKTYKRICHSPDAAPCRLDAHGYATILNAFSRLFAPSSAAAATRLFFEIVKDMRNAGYNITTEVYTIILRHLTKVASDPRLARDMGVQDQLAAAVRRAHQYLNVEPAIQPDTMLWNQLMDAYQRVGDFVEAYRIWEALYRGRQFDDASVSIILDACAWAGKSDMAERIFMNLRENKFELTIRHWNCLLESLCRLGKLDEALKVLCLRMGREKNAPQPDERSVHIVLKFAVGENREAWARSLIMRHLPDLWKRMHNGSDI